MSWSIFKEETETQDTTQKTAVRPTPFVPQPYPAASTVPMSSPVASMDDSSTYEKLKSRTGVENLTSTALKKLFDLEEPLKPVITDPTLRIKAAMAQASTLGVTPTDISTCLQGLDKLLVDEQKHFSESVSRATDQIKASETQAATLEVQLTDLHTDIAVKKSHLDQAQASFTSAFNRRKNEIENLKSQLSSVK